jgi:UDP-N-acetylmuramate dehydrogenase
MLEPLRSNQSLRAFNTLGVDATARYFLTVDSPDLLPRIADEPQLRGVPRLVLGGGSNLLMTRDFDGLVLHVALRGVTELAPSEDAWRVQVGAGENWHALVERLVDGGRPGLENLALIPGLAGAAPIQNIGAYGLEIAERLESVQAWNLARNVAEHWSVAECGFAYRDSAFKRLPAGERLITGITLRLPRDWAPVTGYADVAAELAVRGVQQPRPRDVFDAVVAVRQRKLPDPARIGNAGSFFKNPVVGRDAHQHLIAHHPSLVSYALPGGRFKLAAGWLIEACGLKGATRGRAGVYEKQALVLVNRGGATGGEILSLAREVQDKVREKFGIELEPEPVII